MKTITTFLPLLTIFCIILGNHKTVAFDKNLKGNELINVVCSESQTKDLCLKVLTSDPSCPQASLQDLVLISLKVAAANASGILTECKTLIDDPNFDPAFQQGLADCKETLLDAEGQLEDTIAATLANKEHDAQVWLQAALAAIDTCDASIPGDDDILSQQSRAFRHLCNLAISLSKALDSSSKMKPK
ncbi:pectinesterase inhibitor 28-like [Arachis duranensis]|uniref:Pectinesterase inhibitor 28-like n=1 Tax=Arachis duranensis TaxID=130453 RepID=A0A6P4CIF7_ARADU|nr:pectinesterase inhibitor 28-like [Arachis duranensis]XP_057745638.1 pectinesterase inhibitor 28-like [Arachis stenosperma]